MRFVQLASGVDVVPVLLELNRAAHLWDRNPERRLYPGTPHAAMTDITVRYMPEEQLTGSRRGGWNIGTCSGRHGTSCHRCGRSCWR